MTTERTPQDPIFDAALPIAEARKLPRQHSGTWFCRCGMGWIGEAAGYPNDLRSHASFRVESGEPGAAHDPGLARFRPDTSGEHTPQDVLREALIATGRAHPDDRGFAADLLVAAEDRGLKISLDKAIAEALDSPVPAAKGPVVGWRWVAALGALHRNGLTYEDQPEGIRAALAFAAAAPDTLSEKPGLDVDLAAMRKVEEMLDTYLDAEEAARASNDVIAKLRLAGFVISRSGSTDSEGR